MSLFRQALKGEMKECGPDSLPAVHRENQDKADLGAPAGKMSCHTDARKITVDGFYNQAGSKRKQFSGGVP